MFLNRFDAIVPLAFALAIFGLGSALKVFAPGLHTSGAQMLVWGFFISTTALFHGTSCINSMAHLMGRRRYATGDDSRNSFILAAVTLGEGWHNNHHRYQSSTRNGFFWWELDPTYYLLKGLSWTGLIWGLKAVPASVLEEGEESHHHESVAAALAHLSHAERSSLKRIVPAAAAHRGGDRERGEPGPAEEGRRPRDPPRRGQPSPERPPGARSITLERPWSFAYRRRFVNETPSQLARRLPARGGSAT